MGLIAAAAASVSSVMGDQWKEYFYCEALSADVLAVKGQKRVSKRSSNKHGTDNIISNGSVIAVADGQCMLIVEQGKIVDVCAEPGEYTYDTTTEPSLMTGGLKISNIKAVMANIGKRFTFGGQAAMDQRVYYVNTKEIMGNKYGTASPVPFRVVDRNCALDVDISIRCFGEYSYRIVNPLMFYVNVCANFSDEYHRSNLDSQMKSDILTNLQAAFARISEMGVRYSALPGHTTEIRDALNELLSKDWAEKRGIEIVSFGVNSVKASEEDEKVIKDAQRRAMLKDAGMGAARYLEAQANAMEAAASNTATGPAMGFMNMNAAINAGGGLNLKNLYGAVTQQKAQQAPAADGWTCPTCGKTATGKFCPECGTKKPAPKAVGGWTCPTCGKTATGKFCPECGTKKPEENGWKCASCGTMNTGKFCLECGAKKPAGVPQYKCDKCGWIPEDPANPPRFCPECGDPFGDEDRV